MIVIDDNHRLKKLLFENENLKSITFKYVTADDFLKLSFTSEVVIIDAESPVNFASLREQIDKNIVAIIFGKIEELQKISSQNVLPKETLYIDINTSAITMQSLFKGINYLYDKQENYRNQLVDFDQKISGIVDVFEEHLIQIKKIYDRVVFFRKESLKNIQLYSKYCAGRSPGGDYFDAFTENNKFYLYCTSSNSYLLSNLLMKLFLDLKTIAKKEVDLEFFIKNVELQIRDTFRNDKAINFDFCITEISLNSLEVKYYRTDKFNIMISRELTQTEEPSSISNTKKVLKNTFSLSHEDRLLISSPGFNFLWDKYCEDEKYEEIFKNRKIYPKDLVDELAFQLRSKNNGYFLDTDSSTILVEVNKNAVLEI